MELSKDFSELEDEYPFCVAFDDEQAVDDGGVSRDMFSAFWQAAYILAFDGESSLIPAVHPHVDMSSFPRLGTIMSHGYVVCGFFPVKISFPVIAATFLGPSVSIDDSILITCFVDYVSMYNATILKEAFSEKQHFSPILLSALTSLLSQYNCRQIPNPSNLKSLLVEIARYEFLIKPLGALHALHSGVAVHLEFWNSLSVKDLYSVYNSLKATPARNYQGTYVLQCC